MSQRNEFINLAKIAGKMSEVCRRFGISRKTGYKWLNRYREAGAEGLCDRSRRPHHCPGKTTEEIEQLILRVRQTHPAWGGRKLKRWLESEGISGLPVASTITEILRRHGQIDPEESRKREPYRRFEYPQPNALWQMDFKGPLLVDVTPCYPLTVLDDHSRFSLALKACPDKRKRTVEGHLREAFEIYGLPWRILVDNGSPWSPNTMGQWTTLSVWLLRLGVTVIHSRVRHPETLGKDERFHRTLEAECLAGHQFSTFDQVQRCFDSWRDIYNFERPHESLGMEPPTSRYRVSSRPYPSALAPIEYEPQDKIRQVSPSGKVSFRGRLWRVGKAFKDHPVGIRPGEQDGHFDIYFCHQKIKEIDLHSLREG
jgi:transposase InsO family protein